MRGRDGRWGGLGLILLLALVGGNVGAVELSRYFSDGMVLQREQPVKVWGHGKGGETVTVAFAGQSKQAKVGKDGDWIVTLDALQPSKTGRDLAASAPSGKTVLKDVVVGDVWLFGRQTYVDISLGRTAEGRAAAGSYKSTGDFRVIRIKTIAAKTPQDDLVEAATTGWTTVGRETAVDMSGAAFHFGADLAKLSPVPVGVIDLNMDRYFGIGWMSDRALSDSVTLNPDDKEISWISDWMRERAEARDSGKAQAELEKYWEDRVAQSRGRSPGTKPSLGLHPLKNPMFPSAGYNAVIHPLRHLAMKGVLLQLGNDYPFIAYRDLDAAGTATMTAELDAAWGENYPILKNGYRVTPVTLPYVPHDWQRTFGIKSLAFALILPPSSDLDVYAAHNREIRELHRRTAEKEGLGLIMPGNENVPSSGQPADEKLLADRCRQWVLGTVYKKDHAASGPVFDRMEARLSKATIYFKRGTADGLHVQGDALDMFEAAGPDGEFTPAKASIDGETIKLKSEGPIQFVRYNWTYAPDQGLVNDAGLPALPFNTDADWTFGWIPPPEVPNLPMEYSTTADKWGKSNVAIINGQIANMAQGDSEQIPRRPGPLGLVSSPFGPNIYVADTESGGPAEGKLLPGDVIYGVNGKVFEDGPDYSKDGSYMDLSKAITFSESEEGEGRLVFSLRRGTKLMDVTLDLPVLGSYSSTTPYYCEKSENIVKNAEAWSARRYRPESGVPSSPSGMLNTDLLFLLASGTPEHQGLVRRAVYEMIAKMDPQPVDDTVVSKPWGTGHTSLLLGEYFHTTGDRNVLPYLKYQADLSSASQLKPRGETPETKEAAQSEEQVGGWRHNYPGSPDRWQSGYGLLPHAGMGCVMGMQLGKEAGLDIDELALKRGIKHFNHRRAEYGFVLYSYSNTWRDGPPQMNPEAEAGGNLWSMNGKLGMAASLYNMLDGYQDSVDLCARHCVYGYNRTRSGHGGMFFNNFWTPIGAWAAGEPSFKHFMKGQTWWRELYRRHDGSFNQVGRGHIGVSYALHYVAPKKRLRILGAPSSAFGTNCPDYLKPAIDAHARRDYELCEGLILKHMKENALPSADVAVVNKLLDDVRILRASIDYDLSYCEELLEEGKYYYATLEMPQLRGVVAEDDPRLTAIIEALESPEGTAKATEQRKTCETETKATVDAQRAARASTKDDWSGVVPLKGSTWQMKVVEHISHVPEDWADRDFDDSGWNTATLPISWTMYHTALFRTTFNVDDKNAIDGLRLRGNFFQQANVVVYLNGKLVAKIDDIGRGTGDTMAPFTDYGVGLLRNGENTIAVSSRHKRRWGAYRGTYKTAATVHFGVEAMQAE